MNNELRIMNKILKTILISSIAIFSVCLLSAESVQAQPPDDFVVEFEKGPSLPLFSEAHFLPGDTVIRWIKVTNNSSGIFNIATKTDADKVINDGLGDVLNLEIKQGGASLYNKKLSDFFSDGEVFLSDLVSGAQTQYDYIISFDSEAGNTYQRKSLSFDILIGYQSITQSLGGGVYAFVGGGFTTTTTIPPTTTTTIPGEVAGEITKREFFEEGGEEGLPGTTTTIPLSKFVAGMSIIGPFSCPVNLTIAGINPLLASLLCFGQNACDSYLNPWLVLLLGAGIIIGALYLVAAQHLNYWIAFILALAILIYLLLYVLGICLSPWIIFIIGVLLIGGAVYLVFRGKKVS